MRKIFALGVLIAIFFLAVSPDYSLLTIGEILAKNELVSQLIIQGVSVLVGVVAVIFIYTTFLSE